MKRIIVINLFFIFCFAGCSQETQNELARKKVEYLEGDYKVTFAEDSYLKEWIVKSGKVTSRDTYYFFWAECTKPNGKKDKCYVQTPTQKSVIEEIK